MRKRLAPAAVTKRLAAAAGWTRRAIGAGWSLAAQLAGAGSALAGLYLLTGVAVTLCVGGVGLLAVGTLAELADQPARKDGN